MTSTGTFTRRYYDPYGQPVGTAPAWPDNRAFVGQPADADTGYDLLGARQYNPATGAFLSLDPVFEAGDPLAMGGYAYAADDPATSADPSGQCPCLTDGNGNERTDPNTGSYGDPGGSISSSGYSSAPVYTAGDVLIAAPSRAALNHAVRLAQNQIGDGTGYYFPSGEIGYPVTGHNPYVRAAIAQAMCSSHPGWCIRPASCTSLICRIGQILAPLAEIGAGSEGGVDDPVLGTDPVLSGEGSINTARNLGLDPATGAFRQGEFDTALRIQQERGVVLQRSTNPSVDFEDASGNTYDAVGNFSSKYFDRQWPNLQTRIVDHMSKADFVPVDVSQFTDAQIAQVEQFIAPLGPAVFMVGQ